MGRIKVRLLFSLLVLGALSFCSSVEEQVVTTLLKNYVAAQEALAADDFDGAKNAFTGLAEESDVEIREIAAKASRAADLEQARADFKRLSEEIAQMDLPEGYYLAYCPMADDGKGANWVQKGEEIANPYFGKKMLSCGVIKNKGE